MADRLYSNLYASPDLLPDPALSHGDMYRVLDATGTREAYSSAVLRVRESSPCILAYITEQDNSTIVLAHGPRLFRGLTATAHSAEGLVVALIGGDPTTLTHSVLPERAFVRPNDFPVTDDVAAHRVAYQAAKDAGEEFVTIPAIGAGISNTSARRVIVLPCSMAALAVSLPSSFLTPAQFYDTFLLPVIGDITHEPLFNWWKCATTNRAVDGVCPMEIDMSEASMTAAEDQVLRGWVSRHVITDLMGLRGPPLALAQVTTAIGLVSTQLADTEAQRAADVAAAAITSYGGRFGEGTQALLQRFTRAQAEDLIPEVHQVMASYKERSRDATTLNLALYAAAQDLEQINETNLPKCTPYLLNLFRAHEVIGNTLELGDGANPFSIVCQGHHNTKDVLVLAEKLSTVESGGSAISMADASLFKAKDGRFPQSYLQSVDKLWAFVLVIQVYSGRTSTIATALRRGMREIGPMVLQLESLFYSNPRMGMMIAVRVMLFFQRSTGLYYRRAREAPPADDVSAPDFSKLADDLRMQAYDSLPRVPDTWMEALKVQVPSLFDEPEISRIRGGGDTGGQSTKSKTSVVNSKCNPALKRRWQKCKDTDGNGVDRLIDLKTKWNTSGEYKSPADTSTASHTSLCLKYHLEGKCDSTCQRKATHKQYGTDMVNSFHTFLDHCQVARE